MKHIAATILPLIFLVGCANRSEDLQKQFDQYVGQSVASVAVQYGPPIAAFDTGPGQKAFQWYRTGSYQTGGYATRAGNVVLYNAPQQIQTDCRLTFTAKGPKPDAPLNEWMIISWAYNGSGC